MLAVPDRLADVVQALEAGEPVDYGRVLELQALDIARAGEQFVRETIARHEEADEQVAAGR